MDSYRAKHVLPYWNNRTYYSRYTEAIADDRDSISKTNLPIRCINTDFDQRNKTCGWIYGNYPIDWRNG